MSRGLPEGVVYSHRTAARVYGLDIEGPALIEVTVPGKRAVWPRAGFHVRHARFGQGDVVERRGQLVTSPLRTAFDLARHLPRIAAVAAVDMVAHVQLLDVDVLRQYVTDRAGWFGIAQARAVLGLVEPDSESWMESVLRMNLIDAGLPRPVVQARITNGQGGFVARVDLLYEEARLAIEYDGENHRDRLVEDNRRQNRLQAAGYTVLRFTAADVYGCAEQVVADVQRQLMLSKPRKRRPRLDAA